MEFQLVTSNAHKAQAFQSLPGYPVQHIQIDIPEIQVNRTVVVLHYPFRKQKDFSNWGITDRKRDAVLDGIGNMWRKVYPAISLPAQV